MTDLQYFLDEQSDLQRKMPSPHPTELYNALLFTTDGPEEEAATVPLITFLQWNNKAIIHEIVEEESETGWKPWAKSRHVNIEAARGEWIDQLHFFLNKALALGMDAEMIKSLYDAKHEKNAKRQEQGYDGVSTKCPGCKRALDDEAVHCFIYEGNEEINLRSAYPMIKADTRFVHCSVNEGLYQLRAQA